MTSILLPPNPASVHRHPDRRFYSYNRQARDNELSLENLGIRRNSKLKSDLHGLESCKSYLENLENRNIKYFGHINRKLYDKVINVFIQHTGPDERIILGNKLSRIGLVETLCEFYDFVRNAACLQDLTDVFVTDNEDDGVKLLLSIRRIFCDYSAVTENVVKRLAETDYQRALLADLRRIGGQLQFEKHVSEKDGAFVYNSAMDILYKCVSHPHTKRERFRQSGIVETLTPYLHSKHIQFKLKALLVLAYVLIEDKRVWSEIHLDVFDFLVDAINEAILAKDRCICGFSIAELLNGLTAMHGCYHNKSHFINKHPLPLITGLLESENQSEVHAALRLVWELSFWEQNQKFFQKDEDLLYALETLSQANNQDIRFTAKKTLFVLGQEHLVKGFLSRKTLCKQHIMLSYHKSDQKQALEIYRALSSDGFQVWIDVAEMNKYSDVVDGVIRALEQSSLVVVCFSESYATDLGCRIEAEYAFALKKRIVPLKLQSGYVPRGWLTSVIGSRFYLTLTSDSSFEKQMNNLRIFVQGASTTLTAEAPVSRAVSRFSRGPSRAISRAISRVTSRGKSCCPVYEKNVQEWDEDDVILWATQFKLEGRAWRVVSKLTVKQILYVYAVWRRSPDYFYRWAESVIGLGSVEDLMRFRNAVRSLKDFI